MKKTTTIKNLSFVKSTSSGRNFWSPERPRDVSMAFSSGSELARQYLTYAIEKNSAPILSSIVMDMFKNNISIGQIENAQIIGFLSTIEAKIKTTGES